MNIFQKIVTALRGGMREAGETVVDANAIRIFEQEIHDAKEQVEAARRSLTTVMAKKVAAEREVNMTQKSLSENEGYASKALDQGDDALALEVAGKVARLEAQLGEQREALDAYSGHVDRLKEQVQAAERQLNEYERQLSMVRTTDRVQKATAAITDNFASSDSRLLTARDSLERIRARQQAFEDRMKAGRELEAELETMLLSQLEESGADDRQSA